MLLNIPALYLQYSVNKFAFLIHMISCSTLGLQNSAASCYIVVLIDLSAATVVGVISLARKQVASSMVTGVLYLMAGKS